MAENEVKKKLYYMVMGIKSTHSANLKNALGTIVEAEMDLVWADGMVGCMPVFCDFESALKYSDGHHQVVMITGETIQ